MPEGPAPRARPITIELTLPELAKLRFDKSEIYTTLENRMKCGRGKCPVGARDLKVTKARPVSRRRDRRRDM